MRKTFTPEALERIRANRSEARRRGQATLRKTRWERYLASKGIK